MLCDPSDVRKREERVREEAERVMVCVYVRIEVARMVGVCCSECGFGICTGQWYKCVYSLSVCAINLWV